MVLLNELTTFLNHELNPEHPVDSSVNGLQVANSGEIERIYVAVDATIETLKLAANPSKALFLVHHGLFWKKQDIRIDGPLYQKIAFLFNHDSAMYASHLPLDLHPRFGNNAMILSQLGIDPQACQAFGNYHGYPVGLWGEFDEAVAFKKIIQMLSQVYPYPLQFQDNRSGLIKRVAVVTGDGCDFTYEATQINADLFITGEFSHQSYTFSQEAEINMLYLSHYGSERWGVIRFGELLTETFGLEHSFIEACPKTNCLQS